MTLRTRCTSGAAAAGLVGITLFPFSVCAATGDVDVRISNHTAQDVVEGPNVSIQADFTSLTTHKIARVDFLVDGRLVESHSLDEPNRKGSYVFAWDTTDLSNDVHTISTRVYDEQGAAGASQIQLFVDNQAIDRAAPILRVAAPHNGAVVSGQFDIQVRARQKAEAIKFLEIKLDDDLVGMFNNGSFNDMADVTYDGRTLKDGPHRLQAAVETADGSRVLSPPVIIIVNKEGGPTDAHLGSQPPPVDILPLPGANSANGSNELPGTGEGAGPVDPDTIRGVGLPGGGMTQAAPGVSIVTPKSHSSGTHPGSRRPPTRVGMLPSRSHPERTFAPPAKSHSTMQQGALPGVPPASDPAMASLTPAGQKPLVESFETGWYFHPTLDSQKVLEPKAAAGSAQPGTILSPGSAQRPAAPAPVGTFHPTADPTTLSILPQVASPTRVVIVQSSHSRKAPSRHSTVAANPASGTGAGSEAPVFVPVPLTTMGSPAGKSHFTRPSTPPVLISLAEPRAYGKAASAGALSNDNPVFLPVPLVLTPGSGTGHASDPARRVPPLRSHASRPHSDPVMASVMEPHGAMKPAPAVSLSGEGAMFAPAPFILVPHTAPVLSRPAARTALRPRPEVSPSVFAGLKAHQARTPDWLRVAYDDHWLNFDVQPMMVHGVPVAPFRTIFEYTGGVVSWRPESQTVIAKNNGRSVELKIGSRRALVNDQVVQLQVPAFVRRGRTMIPVGFVRQAMDLNVRFDRRTGQVIITSKHVIALHLK